MQMLKEIIRIGAYGIAIKNGSILLVDKIKGPFIGLLDLPGGGIEGVENPKETLEREFVEEVAMEVVDSQFLERCKFKFEVHQDDNRYFFYHYGYLYRVNHLGVIEKTPDETFKWHPIAMLDLNQLTPFARIAVEIYA